MTSLDMNELKKKKYNLSLANAKIIQGSTETRPVKKGKTSNIKTHSPMKAI